MTTTDWIESLSDELIIAVDDEYARTAGETQWVRIREFAKRLNVTRDQGERLLELAYCELDPPMAEATKMMNQLNLYWLSDSPDPIRDAMENCGKTQAQIARAAGTGRDLLSRFMHGITDLRLSTFDKINQHVGIRWEFRSEEEE